MPHFQWFSQVRSVWQPIASLVTMQPETSSSNLCFDAQALTMYVVTPGIFQPRETVRNRRNGYFRVELLLDRLDRRPIICHRIQMHLPVISSVPS